MRETTAPLGKRGNAGEAEYVEMIQAGELVWRKTGQQVRVLAVVETPETERYAGMLRVEGLP